MPVSIISMTARGKAKQKDRHGKQATNKHGHRASTQNCHRPPGPEVSQQNVANRISSTFPLDNMTRREGSHLKQTSCVNDKKIMQHPARHFNLTQIMLTFRHSLTSPQGHRCSSCPPVRGAAPPAPSPSARAARRCPSPAGRTGAGMSRRCAPARAPSRAAALPGQA